MKDELNVVAKIKKPLSQEAIQKARSLMNTESSLDDEEIHRFATTFWYWSQCKKMTNQWVAAKCKEGNFFATPYSFLESCEKLFLWVVSQLSKGRQIIAAGKGIVELLEFEWVKYFFQPVSD